MSVPSLELQVKAIHVDKANQAALATQQWSEGGLTADDEALYELRTETYKMVLMAQQEATENTEDNSLDNIEDARAWVPEVRNVFKYLRRYKQARVHESSLLLSNRTERLRTHQANLLMEALVWQANQPGYDASPSRLYLSDKRLDQE